MIWSSPELMERLGLRVCWSLDGAGGVDGAGGMGGADAGGIGMDAGGMDAGSADFGGAMEAAGAEMGGMGPTGGSMGEYGSMADPSGMGEFGGMADPGPGGMDLGLGNMDAGLGDPGLGEFGDPGFGAEFGLADAMAGYGAEFGFGSPAGLADPSLGLAEVGYDPSLDQTAFNGFAGMASSPLGPAVERGIAAQFGLEPTVTGPALASPLGYMDPVGATYGFGALEMVGLGLQNVVAQVAEPSFSPDRKGWHNYTAGPTEVCPAEWQCTPQEMKDYMSRHAVPGQDPSKPVINQAISDVKVPGTSITVGQVQTLVSPTGLEITNRTQPGHMFFDGTVTRTATQTPTGAWEVTTVGIGNNVVPGMNQVNQRTGREVFDAVDAAMRVNIAAHRGISEQGAQNSDAQGDGGLE